MTEPDSDGQMFNLEPSVLATAVVTHPAGTVLDEHGHPVLDEHGDPVPSQEN